MGKTGWTAVIGGAFAVFTWIAPQNWFSPHIRTVLAVISAFVMASGLVGWIVSHLMEQNAPPSSDDFGALLRQAGAQPSNLGSPTLFYDANDPNCRQTNGRLVALVGSDRIANDETIYRIGVRSVVAMDRCRLVLERSEPEPHNPGMHRVGLPMRPRIAAVNGSPEFTVNPNAPAYVDVLQETIPIPNAMNEPANLRLIYVDESRGRANWFDHGDYIETFRLEGLNLATPISFRLAVNYDGRREHRRWRVAASP